MTRDRSIRVVIVLAALALAACSDAKTGPGGTDSAIQAVRDSLLLSGPLHGGPLANSIGTVLDSDLVYLSLPPGTVPGGTTAEIRRGGANGVVIATTAMVNGGFDPVPFFAHASDSVALTVYAGGKSIGPIYLAVPPSRPPVVVRTAPPKGRTDVALNQVMEIVFSQPIDPATVTPGTVSLLQGSSAVAGSLVIFSDQPWVARFTPTVPLQPRTNYQLRVSTGVHDVSGLALSSPVTVPFETSDSLGTVASVAVVALGGYTHTLDSIGVASPGGVVRFEAFHVSTIGDTVTGLPFVWSSADQTVATVDTAGTATAVANGSTTISACAGTICGGATILVHGAASGITPTQIGDLGGGDSRVFFLTATGVAVGYSHIPEAGCEHAFIWSAAAGMQDLGTFGGCNSWPDAANDSGVVIGAAESADGSFLTFIWRQATGLVPFTTVPDQSRTWFPVDIDNAGDIAFEGEGADDNVNAIAVIKTDGSVVYAPQLFTDELLTSMNDRGDVLIGAQVLSGGITYSGKSAIIWNFRSNQVIATLAANYPTPGQPATITAMDINNNGVVSGSLGDPWVNEIAFRWTPVEGFTVYPGPSGEWTRGVRLNDAGDMATYLMQNLVVGTDSIEEANSAVFMHDGTVIALGTLGGTHTWANGINASGLVAGHSEVGSNTGPQEGVVWNLQGVSAARAARAAVRVKGRKLP